MLAIDQATGTAAHRWPIRSTGRGGTRWGSLSLGLPAVNPADIRLTSG